MDETGAIYLTEDQQRALDALARIARTNRSAVLRDILDAELFSSPDLDDVTREAFGRLADGYSQLVRALADDERVGPLSRATPVALRHDR